MRRQKKKYKATPFTFSLLLNLLLVLVLVVVIVGNGSGRFGKNMAEDTVTLSKAAIMENAENSGVGLQFLQSLFTEEIVYKSSQGGYAYHQIDRSLPMNDLDWDNLIRLNTEHRELSYVKNGKVQSRKGIDVSVYQGDINWQSVAADGVEYAMIRIGYRGYTEGLLNEDKNAMANIQGALAAGLDVGVYFVTQAVSEQEALEEAQFVIELLSGCAITYPVALDMEDAAAEAARASGNDRELNTAVALAFCGAVEKAGYIPMIYCNIRWFMEELDLTQLTEIEKWFAQYQDRPFFPYDLGMWQYSDSGQVSGIEGAVDLNLGFRDYGSEERGGLFSRFKKNE